ncbi:MAG: hypothetical protein AAGC97_13875, partial [Planctomycetota bacterium]
MANLFQEPPSPDEFVAFATPQPVVCERSVAENIDRMLALSGDRGPQGVASQRLRPHLKTHKSDVITRMQIRRGILRFKASTLGEVAMAAGVGAHSVLLAHQPVGVKIEQFVSLCGQHPDS